VFDLRFKKGFERKVVVPPKPPIPYDYSKPREPVEPKRHRNFYPDDAWQSRFVFPTKPIAYHYRQRYLEACRKYAKERSEEMRRLIEMYKRCLQNPHFDKEELEVSVFGIRSVSCVSVLVCVCFSVCPTLSSFVLSKHSPAHHTHTHNTTLKYIWQFAGIKQPDKG